MSNSDLEKRAGRYAIIKKAGEGVSTDPLRQKLELSDGEDSISGARKLTSVDVEWLELCENVLPHIGKAIEQSRSLIKKDGEVVRIDRAKRPSKESVTHLCRHSNLIKRVTDDGAVAPEEIYISSNEDDLSVYENRFLYFAATYIYDFISLKYDGIKRASSESGVSLKIKRRLHIGSSNVTYGLELSETSSESDGAAELVLQQQMRRMREAMNTLAGYLSLPLMRLMAGAPRLTPPVVRTNIIKNNVSFSQVYDAYMYLSSYSGDGFVVKNDAATEKRLSETAKKRFTISRSCSFSPLIRRPSTVGRTVSVHTICLKRKNAGHICVSLTTGLRMRDKSLKKAL